MVQIWSGLSTNEWNKEIDVAPDVVGVPLTGSILLRLRCAVLVEQHARVEAGDRRYLESSMLELKTMNKLGPTN
jgi:hypothetical protein